MRNKKQLSAFLRARKRFNQYFGDLHNYMGRLSDSEVLNYLNLSRKIRRISQLVFILYLSILKLNSLLLTDYGVITFIFASVFIVLYALLYGLEVAHSDTSIYFLYVRNKESQLSETTFKQITREKFVNFFTFIFIGIIC